MSDRAQEAYMRAAYRATLLGEPFETLVDACHRIAAEEAAAKVINLADIRAKLRPEATSTER